MKTLTFFSQSMPSSELLQQLEALQPENPFATALWIDAERQASGCPVLLGVGQAESLVAGCIAYLRQGRVRRTLSIPSLPSVPAPFWLGMTNWCRTHSISVLEVNTFGSPSLQIPKVMYEAQRAPRYEFVLTLHGSRTELLMQMQMNHRQRVRKGAKAGLRFRASAEPGQLVEHVRLIEASFKRRQARGESVPEATTVESLSPFVTNGSCTLYQAVLGDEVVSSMIVARSRLGRYLHTSGTSPAGMNLGASHFLIHEISCAAKAEGATRFNLGGAPDRNSGLAAYKANFGAECVPLESARFFSGGHFNHALQLALDATRRLFAE